MGNKNTGKMRRIYPGRYEDGTYGIRHTTSGTWQTFRLANEANLDGGWLQSYGTLREAKEGVAWCYADALGDALAADVERVETFERMDQDRTDLPGLWPGLDGELED